ncbi:MAG: hypothetical protein JW739_06260 [Opitutales bacterium]|nr:hypothetical protein [Opitutales bacterium]
MKSIVFASFLFMFCLNSYSDELDESNYSYESYRDHYVSEMFLGKVDFIPDGSCYRFMYDTGMQEICLNGDLGGLNLFLSNSIKDPVLAAKFIDDRFLMMLVWVFSKDKMLIYEENSESVDFFSRLIYYKHIESDLDDVTEESIHDVFENIVKNPELIIEESGTWSASFYAIDFLGGVEYWECDGIVFPLQILSIKRTSVIPVGRYYPDPISAE